MDLTQTPTKTPEQKMQENLQATMAQAPEKVATAAEAEGAKMESPEARQKKMERAEEIRRVIADVEARQADAARRAQEDEAKAAGVQERINAVLGQHNILDVVRKENADLAAVLQRQKEDLIAERAGIEKDLAPDKTAKIPPSTQ